MQSSPFLDGIHQNWRQKIGVVAEYLICCTCTWFAEKTVKTVELIIILFEKWLVRIGWPLKRSTTYTTAAHKQEQLG